MTFKLFAALAFVAVASASLLVQDPRVVYSGEPFNPFPQYTYTYGVNDVLSGDSKGFVETRDGEAVRGDYSVVDSDDFKRTVKYTTDVVGGLNAMVDRKPLPKEEVIAPVEIKTPIVAPITAPIVAPFAAPLAFRDIVPWGYAGPLTFSAPELIRTSPYYVDRTLLNSVPAVDTRSVFNPALSYTVGTPIIQSLPLTYGVADPTLIKEVSPKIAVEEIKKEKSEGKM